MECNHQQSLNKLSNGFTLEKRFETEFEKIEKIGRGGFASVYKMKNILDNSIYAIKKIKIKSDQTNANLQREICGVLQEIRYLAKFKSEYVITYNHSWVEVNLKDNFNKNFRKNTLNNYNENKNEEKSFYKNFENKKIKYIENNYDSVYSNVPIDFLRSSDEEVCGWSDEEKEGNDEEKDEYSNSTNKESLNNSNKNNTLLINNKEYQLEEIESISIFIQMELCKETLGDFLERRNKKLLNKKNQIENFLTEKEDLKNILIIFDKILSGVEYIHNKEKLIHRDLKPNNIFFTFESGVKIGDLGLATNSFTKCEMISPSPILERSIDEYEESEEDDLGLESSFKLEIEETESQYLDYTNKLNFECEFPHMETHTSNIGTSQYAAPEQLNNIHYCNKVDIYSLGLILLELFYPLRTRMEKHEIQEKLKENRKLPEDINNRFNKIGELILLMTEIIPDRRPNINQCKNFLKNIMDSYEFYNIKKLICNINHNSNSNPPQINLNESLSFKEKRRRFLSEDITNIQPNKMLMKVNEDWKDIWIKILNFKLLIFSKINSQKANVIYDLSECEIKGNFITEINSELNKEFKRSSNNTFSLIKLDKEDKKFLSRRKSSGNLTSAATTDEDELDYPCNKAHLNYLVEIDHPYQQKILIKGEHVFETLEFYKKIKKLINSD